MGLPQDKLTELQRRTQEISHTSKTTFRDLQSIIGLLNFASQVVESDRAFIRRLIDATIGVKRPKHKIRETSGMRQDLVTLLEFLNHYNGTSLFPERLWVSNDTLQFFL